MVSPVCSNAPSLPCSADLAIVEESSLAVSSSDPVRSAVSSVFQRTLQSDAILENELFQGSLRFVEQEWLYETPFKRETFSDLSAWMQSVAEQEIFPLRELDVSGMDPLPLDALLPLLEKCRYLRTLNLSGIQDVHLNRVLRTIAGNCPYLQKLELRECCQILDVFLEMVIQNCLDLRHLDVSYCKSLTGRFCVSLANCSRHLEVLAVDRSDQVSEKGKNVGPALCIRGRGFADVLRNNPQLVELHLCGQTKEVLGLNMLDASPFISVDLIVQSCPHLQFLDIGECDWAKGALPKIGAHCFTLEVLRITGSASEGIDDRDLIAFSKNCRTLKAVHMEVPNGAISDASIELLASQSPSLTYLTLEGVKGMTGRSLQAIAKNCPQLEFLRLKQSCVEEGAKQIEEEEMVQFLENMRHMQALRLENFPAITPALFSKLPHRFSSWQMFSMKNCGSQKEKANLSERVIRHIADFCPQIVEVDFSDCPQLQFNVDSLVPLMGRCEALRRISLSPFEDEKEHLSQAFLKVLRFRLPALESLELGPFTRKFE